MKPRLSNGTWVVVAILAFAVLIAVGRSVMKRMGDRFQPTTIPAAR